MSLVVVGSVAYDGLTTPAGKVERALGGACTYISLAASYFTRVNIVGIVGEDFAHEDYAFLDSRGIGLEGLERVPGKTFYWAGVYSDDMNDRETLATDLNVFANFDPKLPEIYRKQPYLMLGNIQPSLQRSVRNQMTSPRLVGGDTMNYWIQSYRDELLVTLHGWDFLLINDSEARQLSGERNLKRAAAKIRALGPRLLVIKRGEYGAILFTDYGYAWIPGILLDTLKDPTGAGDCFAGGFIGYLASQNADGHNEDVLRRAVVYGCVMGSFCCEEFGVDRFRTLTRDEVETRFADLCHVTAI
ncbi:MAG: sugar kinase [Bryobacteraceae bacterium]|jgi:sugar/nucleoside kinase (ribokinase family)|nr:sugar kinase [Bryobacteraceae bacterium]